MLNNSRKVELKFKGLGTDIYFVIIVDNSAQELLANRTLAGAKKILAEFEIKLSRFSSTSEISVLNQRLNVFQAASEDVRILGRLCLDYNKKSDGVFDPRILTILCEIGYDKDFSLINQEKETIISDKSRKIFISPLNMDLKVLNNQVYFGKPIDFTGIAKGYIADKIKEYYLQAGFKNFLIDLGGDVFCSGKNQIGQKWRVEIEGFPSSLSQILISNMAIATSGITRRKWITKGKKYHHLINPADPSNFHADLRSVTVLANSVVEADAWAKVLFILGRKNGMAFSLKNKLKSAFLDYRGDVYLSSKMKKFINNQ